MFFFNCDQNGVIEFLASQEIVLKPGFSTTTNFTQNGCEFHAHVDETTKAPCLFPRSYVITDNTERSSASLIYYPTPTNGTVNIDNWTDIIQIELLTLKGKIIFEKKIIWKESKFLNSRNWYVPY